LRKTPDNEYASVNFAMAAEGFGIMGWQLIGYENVGDILGSFGREDILVGYIEESKEVLTHLGIEPPKLPTYPEELSRFLGRKTWLSTINTIAGSPDKWPVFVKPRHALKKFTGVLVRGTGDLMGCGDQDHDTEVYCSEPVVFVAEWRCFIRHGRIMGVRPYQGDWRCHMEPEVIEQAVKEWEGKPRGCALDFGLDGKGRTLLVEANDGFSIGAYGLYPRDYARLLSARWTELTGTRDECDF
jgi:hypothetical protein